MTKLRAPLTFDNALSRIAGAIGWAAMADVAGAKERTVRNWGDPDTEQHCTVKAAVALDLAFQAAGNVGAPMHETYSLLLEQAHAERFADQAELARRTSIAVHDFGEAGSALICATLPGATDADRANAVRAVENEIAALSATVPLLTAEGEPP